jgi:hypothetical protein
MKITKKQLKRIVEQALKPHQPNRVARRLPGGFYRPVAGDRVQIRNSGKMGTVLSVNGAFYVREAQIQIDDGAVITRSFYDLIPRG